jgi:hypothetical protein
MYLKTNINNIIHTITRSNNWLLLSSLLLTAIALFFGFPSYGDTSFKEWQPLFEQAADPFASGRYGGGSHAGKLAFRLVIPLIIHFTHLGIKGVLVLLGIVGMLNFYMVMRLADKILHNRHQAFIIGLCTAFIYFGKCSFIELRGTMYDGLAIFFLLCALNAGNNILMTLCIFIAPWCDERALIASSLVWLFYFVKNEDKSIAVRFFTVNAFCVYLAWATYFGIRYWLAHRYGLHSSTAGVGIHVLLNQVNNIPIGTWSALEGLWILLLYSMLLLYRNKKIIEWLMYAGICSLILFIGLSVVDITRSVVYIVPAVFTALLIIARHDEQKLLGRLLVGALVLCFAYPAYYTGGKSSIWWTYPLPLQCLRFLH